MPIKPLPPPVRPYYDTPRLISIADRATGALAELRDALLDPWPRKTAPMVTSTRLSKLLGITVERLNYLIKRGEVSPGHPKGNGRYREYTLEETQEIVRQRGPYPRRPEGVPGQVISVGNFKGGVGKTTNAVALAQGLTLHGHRVLLIDLDPQASSTTLMGYVPDAEVTDEMTVMPLVYEEQVELSYAIQTTYWPNLDFIPASPSLFGADFYLPNKQSKDPEFEFWDILDKAMTELRKQYDVIVIDTPPTLSYLAIASFMATDGLVVPVPPETLDYASSTQFFRQFAELFKAMSASREVDKRFRFIKIVLSKVKETAATTNVVRGWLQNTYPDLIASSEVLESDVVKNSSAQFKTVYDLGSYEGSVKTFTRALETFDAVVSELESEMQFAWAELAAAQEQVNGD
jgi:chromosome partitioning protein